MQSATSLVELFISCKDLIDKDFIGKSDPFVVLYEKDSSGWKKLGQTETIKNCLNPVFKTQFKVDYFFQEVQTFKADVYDEDDRTKHDLIGSIEFVLGQIIGAKGQSASSPLPRQGHITFKAEEMATCSEKAQLQFQATNLANLDGFFGKSDPFLTISRSREDGTWMKVFQTETVRNDLNPIWKSISVSVQALCNGDYTRPLRIQVHDEDKGGKSELIGSIDMNFQQLTETMGTQYELFNPELQKKKPKKYKNSGTFKLNQLQIHREPSFIEYLRGGCELNLIVGIDFTASNGPPHDPKSLHYFSPHEMNQYFRAIYETTSILQSYDADQQFPVFGFGGQVGGHVNHCFPLTFNPMQPNVQGVAGISQIYAEALTKVVLSGPTLFSPLIEQACVIASQFTSQTQQKYFVLLIITDGAIMDMQQTIDTLVRASRLPLSVIIVGVGDADFSSMERLDADEKMLRAADGTIAVRDVVQFVPFNKFKGMSSGRLAKETLCEIPKQLVNYMKIAQFTPNPCLEAVETLLYPMSSPPAAPVVPDLNGLNLETQV